MTVQNKTLEIMALFVAAISLNFGNQMERKVNGGVLIRHCKK